MTTRHRSTFYGPQRAIQLRYPDWVIHMQLHDLQPGEFWNPAKEADLLGLKVLTPRLTATSAFFEFRGPDFIWSFRISNRRNQILCTDIVFIPRRVFFLRFPFAVHTFAYSSQTDPAGFTAIGGSATISWKRV